MLLNDRNQFRKRNAEYTSISFLDKHLLFWSNHFYTCSSAHVGKKYPWMAKYVWFETIMVENFLKTNKYEHLVHHTFFVWNILKFYYFLRSFHFVWYKKLDYIVLLYCFVCFFCFFSCECADLLWIIFIQVSKHELLVI